MMKREELTENMKRTLEQLRNCNFVRNQLTDNGFDDEFKTMADYALTLNNVYEKDERNDFFEFVKYSNFFGIPDGMVFDTLSQKAKDAVKLFREFNILGDCSKGEQYLGHCLMLHNVGLGTEYNFVQNLAKEKNYWKDS